MLPVTLALLLLCGGFRVLQGQPLGRSPDVYGIITNITREIQHGDKSNVVATIRVKDEPLPVQITDHTVMKIEKGKIVEPGKVPDLKPADRVSVWFKQAPAQQPTDRNADTLILFRPGQSGAPNPPKAQ